MKCPSCQAHNPDTATFCSLCHTSFVVAPEPEAEPEPAPDVAPGPAVAGTAQDDQEPGPVRTATKGTFRRTEEGFEWQCPKCREWTPLELTTCRVCTTPFRSTLVDEGPDKLKEVDPNVVLGLSIVLPGLGHLSVGRSGIGASRLILWLIFAGGGILLLGQSSESSASTLAAVPMLLGALVVWVSTLLDTRSLTRGSEGTVLPARAYLWLMVGVFVMTIASVLPAAMRAAN